MARRVLVVDDNADMRAYVTGLLSEHWTVQTAADGEEALALIETTAPHLVVSDVMMPGMDGFALLRHLQTHRPLEGLPLLSAPRAELRMLNHWDNVDTHPVMGQVERGYSGGSIFWRNGGVAPGLGRGPAPSRRPAPATGAPIATAVAAGRARPARTPTTSCPTDPPVPPSVPPSRVPNRPSSRAAAGSTASRLMFSRRWRSAGPWCSGPR